MTSDIRVGKIAHKMGRYRVGQGRYVKNCQKTWDRRHKWTFPVPAEVCTYNVLSKLLQDFSTISISYYRQLFRMIHNKRKLLSKDAVLGFENAMIIRAR